MQTIFAKQALLTEGWSQSVRITHDHGHIAKVDIATDPKPGDARVDTLLPAPGNLHSHSFQRAMAGMTEYRAAARDSFWTWRALMYQFMDRITPAQYQAIAAQVFMEMQEAGYASVGEFHYVHHQIGGTPYAQLTELSQRVFEAALETGIGLTHLPVLYTYGGAGEAPLNGGQQRFGCDLEQFQTLLSQARTDAKATLPEDTVVGVAPHSLRATRPADLTELADLASTVPFHMHIAEQPKEVDDVRAWLGARPVEWLLDNHDVNEHWCLIHASHMTDAETDALAASGAVAGLCPITEANLGDGPFNGPRFAQKGGAFGIGSDSNIRISLNEELRTLEYAQRMRDLARNVMGLGEGSVGQWLYTNAAIGSAQALGRNAGRIETGALADLVAINSDALPLMALRHDQLLDGWCFASGDGIVTDVWSAGRHCVTNGRHSKRPEIEAAYRHAMKELVDSL